MSPDAEVVDVLVGELLEFEDLAREELGCAERVRGARSGLARSRSVAWLVEQLVGVLAVDGLSVVSSLRPAGGEPMGLVEWSLGWEERLREVVEDEPRGASPARCRCGERSLRWDARVRFFVCGTCGNHVSEVEERGLVAEEAG
ncbi:hypothetical protein ACIBQ1_52560 [Nonomuraea sp. NPDC050153]|uniref:hypothetical protein n=1 Tax=Nonomuraea sp. NPDC050153 TaxID=3364359 RepID=UPI0037974871